MKKTFLTLLGISMMTSVVAMADINLKSEIHHSAFENQSIDFHLKGKHPSPEKFATELGLTSDQKKQAEEMRQKMRSEIEPLKKQMDELRQKIKDIREKNKTEFEKILTLEQKEKLQKMHDRMKHRFKEKRHIEYHKKSKKYKKNDD